MVVKMFGPPATHRRDVAPRLLIIKWERGDLVQRFRYKVYPTIDVDPLRSYAGTNPGTHEETVKRLYQLGFRNNPTAYVEILGPLGPDDGSYARQTITEQAITPRFQGPLGLLPFHRVKRQLHVVLNDAPTGIDLYAHEERSAWLQPLRHGLLNDANYRIGVRDFRNTWLDTFHTPLGGGPRVSS